MISINVNKSFLTYLYATKELKYKNKLEMEV